MDQLINLKSILLEIINNKGVLGFTLFEILLVIFFFIFALLLRGVFARFIINKVTKIVKKTNNKIDDTIFLALSSPLELLPIVFVFFYLALYTEHNSILGIYLYKINKTLITILIFWLAHQLIIPITVIFKQIEKVFSKALSDWVFTSLKYLIIFLGIVSVLETWGIRIGPIIAGLGLFGVAVALGAQDLFKNLISGILIIMEKRLNIGDVINLKDYGEGTVEQIGFRSTTLRKFDSTPITIPNYIFANSAISNMTKRKYRRINWVIGLEYSTSIDQIRKITFSIKNFINENTTQFMVDGDYPCFVRLEKFNDSSIDILVYCYLKTNDWDVYLEIKENLAFQIKQIIEIDNKAKFAFPSQSIYIEKK